MSIPISAIVLTRDEEANLPECLAGLAWADEVLVVDSFSTDATVAVAEGAGARVVQHAFRNYAAQRNFAQGQARHDWVLFVDADERVSDELRDTIRELARSGKLADFNGYYLHRAALFSGRWWPDPSKPIMPAGRLYVEYYVPGGLMRLFSRRLGSWERPLHEVVRLPRPHGLVRGVLYHLSETNLSLVCEPLNRYTDLEAAFLHQSGRTTTIAAAAFRGARSFVYHYCVRGLWRYGAHGFLMAATFSYAKFLNYAKLWERVRIQRGQGIWTEHDRRLLDEFDTGVWDDEQPRWASPGRAEDS